jgi:hypothetical protein
MGEREHCVRMAVDISTREAWTLHTSYITRNSKHHKKFKLNLALWHVAHVVRVLFAGRMVIAHTLLGAQQIMNSCICMIKCCACMM